MESRLSDQHVDRSLIFQNRPVKDVSWQSGSCLIFLVPSSLIMSCPFWLASKFVSCLHQLPHAANNYTLSFRSNNEQIQTRIAIQPKDFSTRHTRQPQWNDCNTCRGPGLFLIIFGPPGTNSVVTTKTKQLIQDHSKRNHANLEKPHTISYNIIQYHDVSCTYWCVCREATEPKFQVLGVSKDVAGLSWILSTSKTTEVNVDGCVSFWQRWRKTGL